MAQLLHRTVMQNGGGGGQCGQCGHPNLGLAVSEEIVDHGAHLRHAR